MNKIISYFNRLFVIWIILGGLLAYYLPEFIIPLKGYMDIFFAVTMFGIGMVLNISDFLNIFKNIKIVVIGVISQFTIMPLAAYLISKIFTFSNEFSLGLILTGSAPGAMASNILSYLACADVAYSVSLTTVSTFLAPILTPLLTLTLAHTFLKIPFWEMFFHVLEIVLIPLVFGILIKNIFNKKVQPIIKIFPAISTIFITFICSLVIALNRNFLPDIDILIFIAVLLLNISGLYSGYLVGHLVKFDLLKKRALSIEIGMQNAGLGSVLALKHFNEKTALPAVIFVFICIFTASILVPLWSKKIEN